MAPSRPKTGGAQGEADADQVREREPEHARRGVDDDEARAAEELLDRGRELTHPEHVEDDVEQAAVEVDAGEERPPPAGRPRGRARHAEPDEGAIARR